MGVNKEIKRLLLMNGSSNVIFNFIGIFVNLYIWQKDKSIFDVTWFNLVMFITWGFAFVIGSKLLTKVTTKILIRSVAVFGAATFIMLVYLHLDNRILWISCIAVPVGFMWGFYAVAQNISLTVFGKGKDFESFFSLSSIIGQTISIANPILFALVISWIGFNGSFLLMFIFVVILLVVSFYIPGVTLKDEKEQLFRGLSPKKVFSYALIRWMVPSCLAAGVFLQFQGLFSLVFTFSVSENKFIIALLSVGYTIATIIAMTLYKKINWKASHWLNVGMAFISIGFLIALAQNPTLLVFSNILTTVGMFYFGTVWNTRQFKIISHHTPMEQSRILIWRELFLITSRIGMLILVLNVKEIKGPTFLTLMALAIASTLITPYLSNKSTEGYEDKIQ